MKIVDRILGTLMLVASIVLVVFYFVLRDNDPILLEQLAHTFAFLSLFYILAFRGTVHLWRK